jgi:hypothetical protein
LTYGVQRGQIFYFRGTLLLLVFKQRVDVFWRGYIEALPFLVEPLGYRELEALDAMRRKRCLMRFGM